MILQTFKQKVYTIFKLISWSYYQFYNDILVILFSVGVKLAEIGSPLRVMYRLAVTTLRLIIIISPGLRTKRSGRIIKQQNNQSLSRKHIKTYL